MSEGDALDLVQTAIWMTIVGTGPAIAAALAVGLIVALAQALTQVQEATLTFAPKMLAVVLALSATGAYFGGQLSAFTERVYLRIETGF